MSDSDINFRMPRPEIDKKLSSKVDDMLSDMTIEEAAAVGRYIEYCVSCMRDRADKTVKMSDYENLKKEPEEDYGDDD